MNLGGFVVKSCERGLRLSFGLRKYRFTEGGNAGGDGETGRMVRSFGTIREWGGWVIAKGLAVRLILFLLLFDIDGYLKGYAGGLVVFRSRSLHIGLVGFAR